MARWLRWSSSLTCAAALAVSATSAETTSDLARDPRLDGRITIRSGKKPLGDLLKEIEGLTRVPLRASAETADEPAILFVTERPAREVLQRVAAHFDFRWRGVEQPSGWRWELHRDLAGRQREEKLRAAWEDRDLHVLAAAFRERVHLMGKTPESLLAAADAFDDARGNHARPEAPGAGAENALMWRERSSRPVRELAGSYTRALLGLVNALPDEAWQQLREGLPLRFSSREEPGFLPLPKATGAALRTAVPWILPPGYRANFGGEPGAAESFAALEARVREQWRGAAAYRVRVVLKRAGSESDEGARLAIHATPVMPPDFGGGQQGPAQLEIRPERVPPAAPAASRVADPSPILARSEPWTHTARTSHEDDASVDSLNDDLVRVAQTYRINLVADAYRHAPYSAAGFLPRVPVALRDWLETRAGPIADWERRGEWILVRRRRWFMDRRAEIPPRIAEAWSRRIREQNTLWSDDMGKLVLELSDEQLPHFPAVLRERGVDIDSSFMAHLDRDGRQFLRAYGSLTPAQRQLLRTGGSVPFRAFPPEAARAFDRLYAERDRRSDVPESPERNVGVLRSPPVTARITPNCGTVEYLFQGQLLAQRGLAPGFPLPEEGPHYNLAFAFRLPGGAEHYYYAFPPLIAVRPESPEPAQRPGGALCR